MNADGSDQESWHPGYQNKAARVAGVVFTGVWLLYLIGPVADLLTGHYGALYTGIGLAIIVVFCVVYLILVPNWPEPRRYTLPGLAALALLAAAACVIYGGAGSVALWIFMSSACGLLVTDRRWSGPAVAGCIACYVIFSWTGHVHLSDFLSDLLPVLFIGFAMIGLRRQFRLTAELARAREEVAHLAASEERLRLARDMHDLTGQSLSMITLKSELAVRLLGRLPDSPARDQVRDEIEQVAAVSRQTLRDIREAISGYRRPTLAVEIITARAALASAGITARDDPELTLLSGTFDPDAEAALAWCLREAVTNVVRHSAAKNCRISLTDQSGVMTLTVRDDGTGHAVGAIPPEGAGPSGAAARVAHSDGSAGECASMRRGSGLHGMAERLSAAGGSLELRPDARPGFCLIAAVPARSEVLAPPAPADRRAAPEKIMDR
jgi:two-component system sensor histidine kinase DesK